MKDRVGNEINIGDFIVYVTKSESPSLQFGWVDEFKDVKGRWSDRTTPRVKICHAEPDGTRITKTAVDVPGHWRPDTPLHVRDYRHNNFQSPTREERDMYYVPTTYRDTGKPSTVWLDAASNRDARMLVIQPL